MVITLPCFFASSHRVAHLEKGLVNILRPSPSVTVSEASARAK